MTKYSEITILAGVTILVGLLASNCRPHIDPTAPSTTNFSITAEYESGNGTIKIEFLLPESDSKEFIGYEIYMTNDVSVIQLDTTHIVRVNGNAAFVPGQLNSVFVHPGTLVGERIVGLSLIYKENGGAVRRTRISNQALVKVSQRASLGCRSQSLASGNEVPLCLDTLSVRVDENGAPFVRYAVIPPSELGRALSDLDTVLFSGDLVPISEDIRLDGNKWLLDTVYFEWEELREIAGGGLEVNVLVKYQTRIKIADNLVIKTVLEHLKINYDNSVPDVTYNVGRDADPTAKISQGLTGTQIWTTTRHIFLSDQLSFSVPPNAPVKDEFRFRLLVPFQAPTELREFLAIPGKVAIQDNRHEEGKYFPYYAQMEPNRIEIDHRHRNQIQPGGWIAMPWRTDSKGSGEVQLPLKEYVDEFNRQPAEKRRWYAYELMPSDSAGNELVMDTTAVNASGSVKFVYDRLPTIKMELAIDTLRDSTRWVDNSFPLRQPYYNTVSGQYPLKYATVPPSQELELPFFQMPSYWATMRRSRSFVIEFEFYGEDFAQEAIRRVLSINPESGPGGGDFSWPVAAPSIAKIDIGTNTIAEGALHLEGMLQNSLPVKRNLTYSVEIGSGYDAYDLDVMGYATRLPERIEQGTKSMRQLYIDPILKAYGEENDFIKAEELCYKILNDLLRQESTREITDVIRASKVSLITNKNDKARGSRGSTLEFDTKQWAPGTYILWFATGDRDFISGPMLDEDRKIPGPARSEELAPHPAGVYSNAVNSTKKTVDVYRQQANPRLFRFSRD